MKKLIFLAGILLIVVLVIGCTDLSNTPTKKTEEFFKKYQSLDKVVINDLNDVVNKDNTLNDNQKNKYKDIMKKHYQGLKYVIKKETIDGDSAVVEVEIEITDFKKTKDENTKYLSEHIEEFTKDGVYDVNSYNDYRLEKFKETKDKVKYTLHLSFSKENDKWIMNNLNTSIYDKINGVYDY